MNKSVKLSTKQLLVSLVLGASALSPITSAKAAGEAVTQQSASNGAHMSQKELEQRGRELHQALVDRFKTLMETNDLPVANGNSKDISDVVIPYIPVGMSFADTAILLRAAGLKLADMPPRPAIVGDPDYDRYSIFASITLRDRLFVKAVAAITVHPLEQGKTDATVGKVTCRLGVDSL
ncbi:MAG: hypothetical protein JO253_06180 [Alphaproteobacteria bacterium]|nr:hypothetical protein [Alphaproteobacteria bacterium]